MGAFCLRIPEVLRFNFNLMIKKIPGEAVKIVLSAIAEIKCNCFLHHLIMPLVLGERLVCPNKLNHLTKFHDHQLF